MTQGSGPRSDPRSIQRSDPRSNPRLDPSTYLEWMLRASAAGHPKAPRWAPCQFNHPASWHPSENWFFTYHVLLLEITIIQEYFVDNWFTVLWVLGKGPKNALSYSRPFVRGPGVQFAQQVESLAVMYIVHCTIELLVFSQELLAAPGDARNIEKRTTIRFWILRATKQIWQLFYLVGRLGWKVVHFSDKEGAIQKDSESFGWDSRRKTATVSTPHDYFQWSAQVVTLAWLAEKRISLPLNWGHFI